MLYRPLYVDKIMRFQDQPLVKILTGVRRSGKSTILKMLMDKLREQGIPDNRIISYCFDSMEYDGLSSKAIYENIVSRLSEEKAYLFLDEIQEVDNWEKLVNSLMSYHNVDIYVTGSNSRLMSSEIGTYLTGRYVSFRIYTLSFKEYLDFVKDYKDIIDVRKELIEYIKLGGFPVVHSQHQSIDEAYDTIRDIYKSTIFSDIVRRNNFTEIDQLERIVKFAFDNVGKTFSAQSVSNYLKGEKREIDAETIYNYLSKLESAYILHRCLRYDIQGKTLMKTEEKFYLADTALKYSILGYNPTSIAAMLENIVYLELCRRGYDVYIGKTPSGEIDFVAEIQGDKLYIQVTKEIVSEETEQRELGRLLDIRDNYPKYLLTTDEFADGNYEGIKIMHIADFLLGKE